MKIKDILLEYKKNPNAPKFNIKPRTGHAPTQTGAGEHRDKKKEQKQGYEKHKGKVEQGVAEGNDIASAEVLLKRYELLTQSIRNAIDQRDYNEKFKHIEQIRDALEKHYGIDPDKMNEQGVAEGWSDAVVSRRTGIPRTPYSVYIKGKKWKDFENDDHARVVMDKLKAKFRADGRDPETITIAPTDMSEGQTALEKFRKAAAEREKKHSNAEKEMKARHASGKEDMKGAIDRLEKHLNKESIEIPFNECPSCRGPIFHESLVNEKQDACYHKVRSRYKVWPSAYASGALVQCRKKGAKNWGNKSKK